MLLSFVIPLAYLVSRIIAVQIDVTTPAQARVHQPEVTLRCRYTLDQPGKAFTIKWKNGSVIVLKTDSKGDNHPGQGYEDKVRAGEGCSLVILNSRLEDAGEYTVRILAPADEQDEDSADVLLKVTSHTTSHTTSRETDRVSTATSQASKQTHSTEASEDENEDQGYLIPTILLTICSTICLGLQLFFSVNDVFIRRKGESQPEWKKRVWAYVLSRAVFLIFIGVLITSVFGILRKNVIVLAVSGTTFFVGVIIQVVYMKIYK